jgi:hypothetical protein
VSKVNNLFTIKNSDLRHNKGQAAGESDDLITNSLQLTQNLKKKWCPKFRFRDFIL